MFKTRVMYETLMLIFYVLVNFNEKVYHDLMTFMKNSYLCIETKDIKFLNEL